MADRLANGKWDTALAGSWHEQALRLGRLVGQAGSAIGWSRESMRGNHRGLGAGGIPRPGKRYDDALTVLDQAAVHIAGVTRTALEMGAHDDAAVRTDPQVTGPFAAFLRHTGQALGLYGRTRFAAAPTKPSADEPLRRAVGNLRHSLDEFRQQLPGAIREDPDALATHGALLAQARRLADQLAQG